MFQELSQQPDCVDEMELEPMRHEAPVECEALLAKQYGQRADRALE